MCQKVFASKKLISKTQRQIFTLLHDASVSFIIRGSSDQTKYKVLSWINALADTQTSLAPQAILSTVTGFGWTFFASEEPNLRGIQHSVILHIFSPLPCASEDLEVTALQPVLLYYGYTREKYNTEVKASINISTYVQTSCHVNY